MARTLDLNVFTTETLDITLPDDQGILHLQKPTREMVIRIMGFKNLKLGDNAEVIVDRMDAMACDILNSNDVDRRIERAYVEKELNTRMKVAIIEAYAAWIGGFDNDPN